MKKLSLLCIPMLLIFLAGCEYENPAGYMGLHETEKPVLQILSQFKDLVLDTSFDVDCNVDDRFGLKELTVIKDKTTIARISDIEPGIHRVRIDIKYLNDGNNIIKFNLTDASGNVTVQELSVSIHKRKVVMASERFSVLSELNKGMNKLLTDKLGNLWIYHSTAGEMGDRPRLFKISKGVIEEINIGSLNSVSIVCLQIDSKGNPWLLAGTNNLYKYDGSQWQNMYFYGYGSLNGFAMDKYDNIYIWQPYGIIVKLTGKDLTEEIFNSRNFNSEMENFTVTDEGTLYILCRDGIISDFSGKLTKYPYTQQPQGSLPLFVDISDLPLALTADNNGDVWTGNYGYIVRFSKGTWQTISYYEDHNYYDHQVRDFVFCKDGITWLVDGLNVVKFANGNSYFYQSDDLKVGSLYTIEQFNNEIWMAFSNSYNSKGICILQ